MNPIIISLVKAKDPNTSNSTTVAVTNVTVAKFGVKA
jgi:hypothetical protein